MSIQKIFNNSVSNSVLSLSKELSSCSIDRLIFNVSVSTASEDFDNNILNKLKLNIYLKNGVADGQDDTIVKNVPLYQLFTLSDWSKGTGGLGSLLTKTMYFDVLLGNIILTGDDRLTISVTSDSQVTCDLMCLFEDATKGKESILKYETINSNAGLTHNLKDVAQIFSFGDSNSSITISDYFGDKITDTQSSQAIAIVDGCVETETFNSFGVLYKDFTKYGIDVAVTGLDNVSYLVISHAIHSERLDKVDKDTRNLESYFTDIKSKQPNKFKVIVS